MSEINLTSGPANDSPDTPPEAEGAPFARAHHVLLFFLFAVIVVWLFSGFYQVKTDQIAIVERFGEFVSTADGKAIQVEHGLHYHLPWPIDRVNIISVQQVFTLPVRAFNASPTEYEDFKRDLMRQGADPRFINAIFDPYVITADKSVAHVEISVLFRINDPAAWLTSVSHESQLAYDPTAPNDMRNNLFQQFAQRAIVSQVARMDLERVVLEGRAELERGILNSLQNSMHLPNSADPTGASPTSFGVQVQSVVIAETRVPEAVKPAYDDLNNQRTRAKTVTAVAKADANGMVARAEGERSTLAADAQTYSVNTVRAAQGDADRFRQVFEQYVNAPETTRWNIFVDALRTVSAAAKRIVFAQPGQKTLIVVDPPQYDAGQVQSR